MGRLSRRLVIDTDPGIDDAIAILVALAHPGAEVLAITGVAGNVDLDAVMRNIGVILDVASARDIPFDIPFHRGAACALIGCHEDARGFHGEGGLGGASFPLSTRTPSDEPAALAIARLAHAHPGTITLLAIGPLTNVALAIALDPEVARLLERIVVMGGTIRGQGNITPVAEFNAWADPEAYARVLLSGARIEVVSWETTVEHVVPWDAWGRWVAGDGVLGRFVAAITKALVAREQGAGWPGLPIPDTLAAAVALEPACVLAADARHMSIILGGEGRGQTVVDERIGCGDAPNVTVIREFDMKAVERMVRRAIGT